MNEGVKVFLAITVTTCLLLFVRCNLVSQDVVYYRETLSLPTIASQNPVPPSENTAPDAYNKILQSASYAGQSEQAFQSLYEAPAWTDRLKKSVDSQIEKNKPLPTGINYYDKVEGYGVPNKPFEVENSMLHVNPFDNMDYQTPQFVDLHINRYMEKSHE
jgi:hypothetical protein